MRTEQEEAIHQYLKDNLKITTHLIQNMWGERLEINLSLDDEDIDSTYVYIRERGQ